VGAKVNSGSVDRVLNVIAHDDHDPVLPAQTKDVIDLSDSLIDPAIGVGRLLRARAVDVRERIDRSEISEHELGPGFDLGKEPRQHSGVVGITQEVELLDHPHVAVGWPMPGSTGGSHDTDQVVIT
jgi:hypothetical protein